MKRALLAASALTLCAGAALGQSIPPQPLALPPAIAAPVDKPYAGLITLSVDATDLDRRIVRVKETIPVAQPGPMTLLFPAWIPGKHAPRGVIEKLAGLTVASSSGQPLEWTRDPVNVSAFHIEVPEGVKFVELSFQHVSPTDEDQGRVTVTQEMTNVQWFSLALYPAGYFARQIQIQPHIRLPDGWSFATALEEDGGSGREMARFKAVAFDVLMDSPLYAGRYVKKLDLGGKSRVTLNLVADEANLLEVKPAQLTAMRGVVSQADRLFGARHYDHYDFLVALSDRLGGIGVEHQRSTEIGTAPRLFLDWDKLAAVRGVVAHEYVHSWNGKYRRPADQWTADFNSPVRNSLLWVYEGQTQYWGNVLAARSGLVSKQDALDALAGVAAAYDNRVGRGWRALQDTVNDPIISSRSPQAWTSWQRSEDYYQEGQLIWLDVDTLIREQSKGKKSLDDFAKAFFGVNDGDWRNPLTYDFDEVVATLNTVQPYDWATFLRTRLDGHGPGAPLDGLKRGGYRLVYTDTPTDYFRSDEARRKAADLTYALGFVVNKDGELTAVQWEGLAFKAGLTDGAKLVAVNGVAFDGDRLKAAVTQAKDGKDPIELIVRSGERYRTVKLDYHDGLRYPRLERIAGTPARLDDILAARK